MQFRSVIRPVLVVIVVAFVILLNASPQISGSLGLNPSTKNTATWNSEQMGYVYNWSINHLGHKVYTVNNANSGIFIETIGCNFTLHQEIRYQTRTDGQDIRFSPSFAVQQGCSVVPGYIVLG